MRSLNQISVDSLGDYLRVNSQLRSTGLISTANWNQIITIGDYFPRAIASVFGFECSLSNPLLTADFFFCTIADNKSNCLGKNNTLSSNHIWQNIDRFYLDWQDNNTEIVYKIEDIWLEFDLENYYADIPIPSIFFDATNIHFLAEWQSVLDKILQSVLDKPIKKSIKQQFLHCIQALPKNVSAFQVGVLLSRNLQNLRLYTTAISCQQICQYLSQLNWQGNVDLLSSILNRVSKLVDQYQLQLEICNKLSSTIAIEFYCYNQNNLQTLLDYLTTTGFCLPEKRDGLLAFSGSNADFSRRIAYLKMTYTPGNSLQFKAYLGITPKNQK